MIALLVNFYHWLVALFGDRRAGPLVENLIIIAVGFLIVLVLLGLINGTFTWVFNLFSDITGIDIDITGIQVGGD